VAQESCSQTEPDAIILKELQEPQALNPPNTSAQQLLSFICVTTIGRKAMEEKLGFTVAGGKVKIHKHSWWRL
jgi:hypothetical protein